MINAYYLNIKNDDIHNSVSNKYIRLLGFNSKNTCILKDIKVNSSIPFICKMANSKKELSEDAYKMLMHNVKCDELYHITLCRKYNLKTTKNEFNHGLVIL